MASENLLYLPFLLCLGAGLLIWPQEISRAVSDGLLLCGSTVLPSLFPFMVLSSLFVELGLPQLLSRPLGRLMGPLFRVGGAGASAWVLGLTGGYPIGAKTVAQLYRAGLCTKDEACRLLTFCNNCGPAFIVGAVGCGLLHSRNSGFLLYGIHAVSSLIIGILFRFWGGSDRIGPSDPPPVKSLSFSRSLTLSVQASLRACLNITAFILCFSALLRLMELSGAAGCIAGFLQRLPLGLEPRQAQGLTAGFLEFSSGIFRLTDGDLSAIAFLLGWGGLSVHCQTAAILADSGLPEWPCLIGKLLQAFVSASLVRVLLCQPGTPCILLFLLPVPAILLFRKILWQNPA